jgi:type 2 lantibiotic biosynthesis protein LanM
MRGSGTPAADSPLVDWHRLAGAASDFDERVRGACTPLPTPQHLIDARRTRWRAAIGDRADGIVTAQRLAWDALEPAVELRLLSDVTWDPGHTLPPWVFVLRDILGDSIDTVASAYAASDRALALLARADEPIPFEEVLAPFAAHAARVVRDRAAGALDLLGHDAWHGQLRGLLVRLARLAERVLHAEFSHRMLPPALASSGAQLLGSQRAPRGRYRLFVDELRAGGLLGFLARYPVLARHLAESVRQWCAVQVEFLQRLAADRDAVAATLGHTAPPGRVTQITADVGDPHDEGRAVAILTFEDGWRCVYKPRSIALDGVWREVAALYNRERGPTAPDLLVPRHLARHDYGWIEFITSDPCRDHAEVAAFYRRAGVTLALLYAMTGSDYHFENLIPHGAHPVVIDHEALLCPQARWARATDAGLAHLRAVHALVGESVLSVGLLPLLRQVDAGKVAIDLGGLTGAQDTRLAYEAAYWRFPNTDLMRLARMPVSQGTTANVPVVDGVPVYAASHVAAIEAGFREGYAVAQAQVDRLRRIANDARGHRGRLIFRATATYALLLQRTQHARSAADGVGRWIDHETLCQAFLGAERRPAGWRIVAHERAALQRQNIPLFVTPLDSRDLVAPDGERLPDFFELSAVERCHERLARLSLDDMERQASLIRDGFHAASLQDDPWVTVHDTYDDGTAGADRDARAIDVAAPDDVTHGASVTPSAAAGALATAIDADAWRLPDGAPTWVGIARLPRYARFSVRALGFGLGEGALGIAMLHAARPRAHAARGCVRDILRPWLDDEAPPTMPDPSLIRSVDASLYGGSAGIVFGLAMIARLTGDEAITAAARRQAQLLAAMLPHIAADFTYARGRAGIALALLAADALESQAAHARLLPAFLGETATLANAPLDRGSLMVGDAGLLLARVRVARACADPVAEARAVHDIATLVAESESAVRDGAVRSGATSADDASPIRRGLAHGLLGLLHVASDAGLAWPDALAAVALDGTRATRPCSRGPVSRALGTDDLATGEAGRIAIAARARLPLARRAAAALAHRARSGPPLIGALDAALRAPGLLYGRAGIAYALLLAEEPTLPFPLP